jgi:DNA-binding CsgD family transcriptional regulator
MERRIYESLSPRERECLRLVAQGLESKEIAGRLTVDKGDGAKRSLTPGTVDGYLKSASAKLGVSRRKEAARLFAEHEETPPQWLGDQPIGGDLPFPPDPGLDLSTGEPGRRFPLPFRRRGEVNNELSIAMRLLWIPVLTIGLAIGFGMLTSGLKVIVDLVKSHHHVANHHRGAPPGDTS